MKPAGAMKPASSKAPPKSNVRQDQTVGHPPAGAASGASEDEQLLAEDEKFEVAIGRGPARGRGRWDSGRNRERKASRTAGQSKRGGVADQAVGCRLPTGSAAGSAK